jgi:hypothetical protein
LPLLVIVGLSANRVCDPNVTAQAGSALPRGFGLSEGRCNPNGTAQVGLPSLVIVGNPNVSTQAGLALACCFGLSEGRVGNPNGTAQVGSALARVFSSWNCFEKQGVLSPS